MVLYFLKRLISSAMTLLILLLIVFVSVRIAPGSPFDSESGASSDLARVQFEARFGLDQPILSQYLRWLSRSAQGDLGESFQFTEVPVREVIKRSLPVSLGLGGASALLAFTLGILLSCLAVWKNRTLVGAALRAFALLGLSTPTYWTAALLITVFSLKLGWFPAALWNIEQGLLISSVLPIAALTLRPLALVFRLATQSLEESLATDYARTARAKGMSELWVIFKHSLKNSAVPIAALAGPLTAQMLAGSFLIESLFQIPGMGTAFVTSIINRDYPVIMSSCLVFGLVLTASNLFADLMTKMLDPRIGEFDTSKAGIS